MEKQPIAMTLKIPETPHDRMSMVFCKIHLYYIYETFVAK